MKNIQGGFSILKIVLIVAAVLVAILGFLYVLGSSSNVVSEPITTLVEEPPVYAKSDNLLYAAKEVEYAVSPGIYSYFTSSNELAPAFTIAVTNDRKICSCAKKEDMKEVQFFDFGLINNEGYIDWDEETSWPSVQERWDRYDQAIMEAEKGKPGVKYVRSEREALGIVIRNNSLVTTSGRGMSLGHLINLPEDGCVSSWISLYPYEGASEADVCNCGGQGISL